MGNLVHSYFLELMERKGVPNRLALDISDSKILVWAEIENDDDSVECALILSAAKANANFSKYGVHISSTIVEKRDNLIIPKQYKEIEIQRD